jgi:hypothetical protein
MPGKPRVFCCRTRHKEMLGVFSWSTNKTYTPRPGLACPFFPQTIITYFVPGTWVAGFPKPYLHWCAAASHALLRWMPVLIQACFTYQRGIISGPGVGGKGHAEGREPSRCQDSKEPIQPVGLALQLVCKHFWLATARLFLCNFPSFISRPALALGTIHASTWAVFT